MSKSCDALPQVRLSPKAHKKLSSIAARSPFKPSIAKVVDAIIDAFSGDFESVTPINQRKAK